MTTDTSHTSPLARTTQILICAIAFIALAVAGKALFCPLVFSLLAFFLLVPVSRFLERKFRMNRAFSSLVAVLLMMAVMTTIFCVAWLQVASLVRDWPFLKGQLTKEMAQLQNKFSEVGITLEKQKAYLNGAGAKVMNSNTIGLAWHSFSSVMVFLLFWVFDTFFFLYYRSVLGKFLAAVFKGKNIIFVEDIMAEVQSAMSRYIIGIMLEMTIVTVTACIVFSLIGFKYAILLGLLTGLFNVIPYAGIYSILVLNSLFAFAISGLPVHGLWMGVSIFSIHLIDANILLPFIVGSRVKINALATFTGVLAGALIWGIAGIFLSIPVLAIFKIIFDRVNRLKPLGILLGNGATA